MFSLHRGTRVGGRAAAAREPPLRAAAASTEERRDEPLEARRLWSSALNDAHIIFIIAVERTRSTRVANEKVLGCENGRRLQVPSVCDRAAALDMARAPAATTGTSLRSCSDPPLPPLVTMTNDNSQALGRN